MALRHHYSVTLSPDGDERRFHLFAEADERFNQLCGASEASGRRTVSESYWRRHYSSAGEGSEGGAEQHIALDDRGLTPCDELCGGA